MENNDSNIKPQPTGGLKLMTVFIVVLAAHVVVIGGFTVYKLMSGGNTDADLVAADKSHKSAKTNTDGSLATEGQSSDATQTDKSATPPAPPTEIASIPPTPPTPPPDVTAPTDKETSETPSSVAVAPTPTPAANNLTPPPESEMATTPPQIAPIPALSAEVASGPVKMPIVQPTPENTPVSGQVYVVKITDSYYKIAHRHHISVASLKAANNVKSDVLHAGQKLVIPAKTEVASTTGAVAAPEVSATTALIGGTAPTPPLGAPTPGKIKAVADTTTTSSATDASHHHLYTVVKGDTLTKIAHKFKTTANALMAANSISDPAKLSIGKKLKIPSQEARSAKNVVPADAPPGQAKAGAPAGQLANFVQ